MQNGKKWRDWTRDQKNGETRSKSKIRGRHDVRHDAKKKRWRDKMRDKKKWGDKTQDKKKWGDKTQEKKIERLDTR